METNFNELEKSLKKRIESGESTTSDNLVYAKIRFQKNRKNSISGTLNPLKRWRDNRAVSDKKISRIVAGRKLTHRERLLQGHASSLADSIKSRAEATKAQSLKDSKK